MRKKTVVAFVGLTLSAALAGWPARAAGTPIVAGPGAYLTTFATPAAVGQVGGDMQFVNGDIAEHNVVALTFSPEPVDASTHPWCFLADGITRSTKYAVGRCPVFWSGLISNGQTTPVLGMGNTTSGATYRFHCEPHTWMTGTLVTA